MNNCRTREVGSIIVLWTYSGEEGSDTEYFDDTIEHDDSSVFIDMKRDDLILCCRHSVVQIHV
eukprot:scaffold10552_cov276-Chaetoceros_neogracile.AAC.13